MHPKPASVAIWPRAFLFALALVSIYCAQAEPTREPSPMLSKSVRITWHFPLAPEEVWAAWTQPALVSQWFGSNPEGRVSSAVLDVRPAGGFEVTFLDADGTEHTASGVYREIEPLRRLRFSWSWKSEPGIETEITVSLISEPTGTRMEFEHGGHTRASSHDYDSGWRSTFAKMEQVIASR